MYSGSTISNFSGRILGAHQNIDRLARRNLERLVPQCRFPSTRAILHFEGKNGPDGIKRKSPAVDEPWHYMQPFDLEDTQLIVIIEEHYKQLIKALKQNDTVRASFEAAWLSHAIVDGLTPAHHYPYEEELILLSDGQSIAQRTTLSKKLIMPGPTAGRQVSNNWKMWGPKGLFTTHAAFECGIAMLIAPVNIRKFLLTTDKIDEFKSQPLAQWFRHLAQDVARMELYDTFYKSGWTVSLARRIRRHLAPALVQAVALVWYSAAVEAGLVETA